MKKPHSHFEGKSVVEHLKAARNKGFLASREVHGAELSGFASSCTDALRETSVVLVLLSFITQDKMPLTFFIVFALSFAIWKAGRSAYLGWSRMERLHRLIEEEKFEIENHRSQEKEELKEMYRAKGLSHKLVDDIADSLMSDDNRLLQVMLEEELGVTLEVYEHPLSQSLGAFLGALLASCLFLISYVFVPGYFFVILPALAIAYASRYYAHKEKNQTLNAVVWMIAISFLTIAFGFFLSQTFH